MTSSQLRRQQASHCQPMDWQQICCQIFCISLSHHTAPVELRERMRRAPTAGWRSAITASDGLHELVVLSTCNRTELYALVAATADASRGDASPGDASAMIALLQRSTGVPAGEFVGHLQVHRGEAAVDHLCRVACGLDSRVLGESEILGQVATAYNQAVAESSAGPALSALFRTAIRSGKRARHETGIGRNPASVASTALAMADRLHGPLTTRRVLVVGAGEMGASAAAALRSRRVSQVTILNRTVARAVDLATEAGWSAAGLDRLVDALVDADVVVSATASPDCVIDLQAVQRAATQRGPRPQLLIDLAVPRDVDPAAGQVPGVRLLDVDDLQETLDEALAARQAEVPGVLAIISEEKARLDSELLGLEMRPLIVDLRRKAEEMRRREVERTLRHLGDVNAETLAHIEHLSHALVNKLLHTPTARLKSLAAAGQAAEVVPTVRDLFGLGDGLEA